VKRAKHRILFIGREPRVLAGLRRALHGTRDAWDMVFAETPHLALTAFDEAPFDVVVTDVSVSEDEGEMLRELMARYPATVRIVLSSEARREAVLRTIGPVHQYLTMPCDSRTLKATLARACALSNLLSNARLRSLVTQMERLPSLPSLYSDILEELHAPDPSAKRVGEIIAQDLGMSAKLLQVVNSAFYTLRQQVTSPTHAVVLLGIDSIRILVLSLHVFQQFEALPVRHLSLNALRRHSILVATAAKRLVERQVADPQTGEQAFMAGLLHDIGKLVLTVNLPQEYAATIRCAEANALELVEAEAETLGATHAEVGAYLLGIWGLPDTLVTATAHHHHIRDGGEATFGPLTAVYVCNALVSEITPSPSWACAPPSIPST
jgi:HD-like signal output (HDOD) protein